MPQPFDRLTEHLLVNNARLLHRHVGDAHGSAATYWTHERNGEQVFFWSCKWLSDWQSAHINELLKDEVKIVIDPIYDRGLVAILPDGRHIKEDMATFNFDQPGVSANGLGDVVFNNRDLAVSLLRNEPYITNFEPKPAVKRPKPF